MQIKVNDTIVLPSGAIGQIIAIHSDKFTLRKLGKNKKKLSHYGIEILEGSTKIHVDAKGKFDRTLALNLHGQRMGAILTTPRSNESIVLAGVSIEDEEIDLGFDVVEEDEEV